MLVALIFAQVYATYARMPLDWLEQGWRTVAFKIMSVFLRQFYSLLRFFGYAEKVQCDLWQHGKEMGKVFILQNSNSSFLWPWKLMKLFILNGSQRFIYMYRVFVGDDDIHQYKPYMSTLRTKGNYSKKNNRFCNNIDIIVRRARFESVTVGYLWMKYLLFERKTIIRSCTRVVCKNVTFSKKLYRGKHFSICYNNDTKVLSIFLFAGRFQRIR